MKKLAIVGYRGMVGSVLLKRMQENNDFDLFETTFLSTSQKGKHNYSFNNLNPEIKNAHDIEELKKFDIILTCQGSGYTQRVYPELKAHNWRGFWVDAASELRMSEESCLVLDPLNQDSIKSYIQKGGKTLVGANCTVSLLLLGLHGLIKEDLIDWASSMTYQAASGSGAKAICEVMEQNRSLTKQDFDFADTSLALDYEKTIREQMFKKEIPHNSFGTSLAYNLIPWIDSPMDSGQTREEWKAAVEASKIVGQDLYIDGLCTRVPALRCHSQAVTFQTKKAVSVGAINELIDNANQWSYTVENTKEATLAELNTAKISGSLNIPVGRIRPLVGKSQNTFVLFTMGDQLLWGAAEPLRRVLSYIAE